MATNYVSPGDVVELVVPSGGCVSGNVYKIGSFVGVATVTVTAAQVTADATITANFAIEGVWDIAKKSSEPWTQGQIVWWNTGAAYATSVSTSSIRLGTAVDAALNPSSTGRVKLNYGSWLNQTP